ncbi:MAG: CD225/dispanin family protein [Muribaculaceae bacterium]|nr:CD225/dispanin family protein [Muribaculaceae bacterium]
MRICPNPKCGKTIENDKAKFCRYCGTALPVISKPTVPDEVVLEKVVPDSDEGIVLTPSPAKDNSPSKGPEADLRMSDGIPLGFTGDVNIPIAADNSPGSTGEVNAPGIAGNSPGIAGEVNAPRVAGNSPGFAGDVNAPGPPGIPGTPTIPPLNNVNQGFNQPYVPKQPDNYLVWAILSTLFCCLPFGVYAIVCATNVNSLYTSGDYIGAQKASANAKKWSIIAAIASLVIWAIIIIVNLASYSGYESEESNFYEEVDTTETVLEYGEEDYSLDLLKSGIIEYKKELPIVIEEGVTIIDIELNESCLLYIAKCDESIVDIDEMNSVKSLIREQIRSSLIEESSNDDELRQLLDNCKAAKRGIGYKYIGNRSGDVCTIMVSYTSL